MAESKKSMSFLQFLNTAAILSLVGGVAFLGFSAVKNRIAAEIYEQKLGTMAADYTQVRTMYNQAVSKVQERLQERVQELDIEFNEDEFQYWRRRQSAAKPKR